MVTGCHAASERGRREREAEAGFESCAIEQRGAAQVVERGRSGAMHAPRLLAHGDDAAARGFSRGEVNVRQLGESVAHLVVDGALAHFAAFDVGDGNAQSERGRCGREHLVAVGDEQQQIGPPGGERVGQAEDGEADGLGHAGVGVGAEQALDARLDRKTVALDLLDGMPNSGERCGPSAKTPNSMSGWAASSRSGQ